MSLRWRARVRSIRVRIVVGYVSLVAIALVLTLLIARGALLSRIDNEVDNDLADDVEQLQRIIAEGDPDTGAEFTDAEVLFDTHLRRVLPADDAAFFTLVEGVPFLLSFDAPTDLLARSDLVDDWAAVTSATFQDVTSEVGPARVLVIPVELQDDRGTFVAAAFTQAQRDELDDVLRVLALVSTVVVLLSAIVAWTIASRVVRPIRDLTGLTRSITDARLSARIPVVGGDEVAELSATFNAMMARLEDGFRTQREFLDDVAHELRTPITIIQGHLDVLGDDPDEREETVRTLNDELARMNRYVDDLLVIAQAEQPDFIEPTAVDLADFGESLSGKLTGLADRRWDVRTPAAGDAVFDQQRMTQALLNLAQNAARHTDVGDDIVVSVTTDDASVRFAVTDTGPGVDPAIIDELFDRHIRSATSRIEGGVGIGLSIVDAIATAHGGRVSVESTEGSGSTFSLTIPLRPPDTEEPDR